MNKAELCEKIANQTNISKKDVESVIDSFENTIIKSLQNKEEVTLTGFGTFSARDRSARMGVNPQNPTQRIKIPAVVVPKFKAGKKLKDELKKVMRGSGSQDQGLGNRDQESDGENQNIALTN